MNDRPTPETKEAWDSVSRLPDGMYDSRVSIGAYAMAMSDHSKKMERQRDGLMEALEYIESSGLSARHLGDIARAAIAAAKGGEG